MSELAELPTNPACNAARAGAWRYLFLPAPRSTSAWTRFKVLLKQPKDTFDSPVLGPEHADQGEDKAWLRSPDDDQFLKTAGGSGGAPLVDIGTKPWLAALALRPVLVL